MSLAIGLEVSARIIGFKFFLEAEAKFYIQFRELPTLDINHMEWHVEGNKSNKQRVKE